MDGYDIVEIVATTLGQAQQSRDGWAELQVSPRSSLKTQPPSLSATCR